VGPIELLAELTRRGVEIVVAGGRLRFRPQGAVTPDLRAALAEHKTELLKLLEDEEHEVHWRMDAMRDQVPRRGAIPTLLARPEARFSPRGTCRHCGDPLAPDRPITCVPCVRAVYLLLHQIREGV
jgi:hypothetical protein